jgi:hypothetical protein
MKDPALERLIAAGPAWQRPGLRVLFALARRPRGLALLARLPPADQAAAGLMAMAYYDRPEVARPLGWDAEAVAARGRALQDERTR